MRILLVGDIVGKGGRRVLREQLQSLQSAHQIDFTIVNVEKRRRRIRADARNWPANARSGRGCDDLREPYLG